MKIDIFDNLLTAPRIVSNTYFQVTRAQSCANLVHGTYRALITCRHVVLRVTWYAWTAQLFKFDRV